MKKVLIDLNIILDFLNKRNFHQEAAQRPSNIRLTCICDLRLVRNVRLKRGLDAIHSSLQTKHEQNLFLNIKSLQFL